MTREGAQKGTARRRQMFCFRAVLHTGGVLTETPSVF
jgi:hypothetical protein